MSVFVLILPEENTEVINRLEKKYPEFQKITPTTFLLSSNDFSGQVADELGLKGENRISTDGGVVLGIMEIYAGRTDPSVWEWLKSKEGDF